jgi:hypothetical protein
MKYLVFTVFDRVSECHGTPYYAVSKGSAIRGFNDEINRPSADNQLFKHPKDFELCYLGTFDDQTAEFELQSQPSTLIRGDDCIKPENQQTQLQLQG